METILQIIDALAAIRARRHVDPLYADTWNPVADEIVMQDIQDGVMEAVDIDGVIYIRLTPLGVAVAGDIIHRLKNA